MLQANSISFDYGTTPILRDVTIAAAQGDRVGILGPNGTGKTTLLHILAGLLSPNRGTVRLGGVDLRDLTRTTIARQLALVPQETKLTFDYSVLEVALMGRYPHLSTFAIESLDDIDMVIEVLSSTGTAHLADRPFSTLSGGEKQRVVISAALAQLIPASDHKVLAESAAPKPVLLLDEPTASLDLGSQLAMSSLLKTLHLRSKVTMVISTHDLNFAIGTCEHLILLHDGVVVAAGPTDKVLTTKNVRTLYDVDVDITRHASSGRLMVLPIDSANIGHVAP